jgi:hypothetical protein
LRDPPGRLSANNLREASSQSLLELAEIDQRIILLTADIGFIALSHLPTVFQTGSSTSV